MTTESSAGSGAAGPMAFVDLRAQQESMGGSLREAVLRVLDHGQYIMGPEIRDLESRLAAFTGVRHCVTCASGTDALLLPLMAWGIGPGDAVFTTAFTFIATAEVISLLGAVPVFTEILPESYNMDPADLRRKVEAVAAAGRLKPRAVIPVDLFGLPADYDAIGEIAREHGLKVLEDGAQSFGALRGGRRACSFGDMGATSFFPAKPLGCYGDGGAIFTQDDEEAGILRSLRVHGQGSHKYENVRIGLNSRFDTLQAAIVIEKFKRFPGELDERDRVAARYTEGLRELGLEGRIRPPVVPGDCRSAWAQYTVRVPDREAVQAGLKSRGIPTMVYYPVPLHLQKAFAFLGGAPGDLPATEAASREVLSLPMHPYLSDREIGRVVAALQASVS